MSQNIRMELLCSQKWDWSIPPDTALPKCCPTHAFSSLVIRMSRPRDSMGSDWQTMNSVFFQEDAFYFLYSSVVVSISDDTADVMVEAAQLTDSQTAQIIDIVQRKTEVAAENIIITLSGAK